MANMLVYNSKTARHDIAVVHGELEVSRASLNVVELFRVKLHKGSAQLYTLEMSRNEVVEVVKQLTEGLAGRA